MQYVIGIDGGGTKSLLKIADFRGNLLASCVGGPSNINSIEMTALEENLAKLIYEGLDKVDGSRDDCSAICMGMAGAGRHTEIEALRGILCSLGFKENIIITDDALTALYGGVGSGTGMIIISGTGSICYGRNSCGDTCRAGGWGHLIGDEGSGYDIGIRALRHVMRSFDGREEPSLLSSMVLEHLKLENPEKLVNYVYRNGIGKKEISDIAKIVDDACMMGDEASKSILDSAVRELNLCAEAVIDRLPFPDEKQVNLAMGGSILTRCRYIQTHFKEKISISYPSINVLEMKNDAAWGAVLIALDKIGRKEK